jgi:hypothetical protein
MPASWNLHSPARSSTPQAAVPQQCSIQDIQHPDVCPVEQPQVSRSTDSTAGSQTLDGSQCHTSLHPFTHLSEYRVLNWESVSPCSLRRSSLCKQQGSQDVDANHGEYGRGGCKGKLAGRDAPTLEGGGG